MVSGAHRDKDGYIWITGRIDDLVNVSGHLLSTAEVESALIEHKAVAEAASVSHPHSIKGECIYCFVTLKQVLQLARVVAGFPKGKGDPYWRRNILETTHGRQKEKKPECVWSGGGGGGGGVGGGCGVLLFLKVALEKVLRARSSGRS